MRQRRASANAARPDSDLALPSRVVVAACLMKGFSVSLIP